MARISAILNLSMCGSHGAHSGDTESQTKKICLVCCRNWGVATLPCHLLPQLGLGNPWTCMACHVRPPSTLVLGVWFLQSPCVWCAQMSAYMHLVHSCVRMPSWQALCSRSRVCRENRLTRHVRACMHACARACVRIHAHIAGLARCAAYAEQIRPLEASARPQRGRARPRAPRSHRRKRRRPVGLAA